MAATSISCRSTAELGLTTPRRAGGKVDVGEAFASPDLHLPPRRTEVNPRRTEVGHATVFEFEPGVGHVFVAAQQCLPHGEHVAHVGPDQVKHQIDVVNHQVQHGADIGRTSGERADPGRLDESRLIEIGLGGDQRRIESFDVPDLQHGLAAAGRGDQIVGLAHAAGQRLFDQDVQAAIEKRQCDVAMRVGGGGDDRRVDFVDQVVIVGDRGRFCRRPRLQPDSRHPRRPRRPAARRPARRAAERGFFPGAPRPRPPIAACSRGSPPFASPAVLPFLLVLDERQKLAHLRPKLVVATQNFASVVQADFGAIHQPMGFGQAVDDCG